MRGSPGAHNHPHSPKEEAAAAGVVALAPAKMMRAHTVYSLRNELRALGASTMGKKSELQTRLATKLQENSTASRSKMPLPVLAGTLAPLAEEPGSPGAPSDAPLSEQRARKKKLKDRLAIELNDAGAGQQEPAQAQVTGLGCPLGHL